MSYDETAAQLLREANALNDALARVRALHDRCSADCLTCHECFVDWPCPTVRALDVEVSR